MDNTNKSSINVKLARDKTGLTNIELAEFSGLFNSMVN